MTEQEVLIIAGSEDFPILQPARAIAIINDGFKLAEPIDLGNGLQDTVPQDKVIKFDEDLQMTVNRLTSTAIDSLTSCKMVLKARAVHFHKKKGAERKIGFING